MFKCTADFTVKNIPYTQDNQWSDKATRFQSASEEKRFQDVPCDIARRFFESLESAKTSPIDHKIHDLRIQVWEHYDEERSKLGGSHNWSYFPNTGARENLNGKHYLASPAFAASMVGLHADLAKMGQMLKTAYSRID